MGKEKIIYTHDGEFSTPADMVKNLTLEQIKQITDDIQADVDRKMLDAMKSDVHDDDPVPTLPKPKTFKRIRVLAK